MIDFIAEDRDHRECREARCRSQNSRAAGCTSYRDFSARDGETAIKRVADLVHRGGGHLGATGDAYFAQLGICVSLLSEATGS